MTSKARQGGVPSNGQSNGKVNKIFIYLWCTLCIIVPFWVTTTTDGTTKAPSLVLTLAYLIVLYAGTRISLIISAGIPTWLPFMFWSFTYIWIGLSMYAQDLSGRNPYGVPFTSDSQEKACGLALLGMIFFDLGGLWSRSMHAKIPSRPRILDRRRLILLISSTLIGIPLYVQWSGGLSVFFTSRAERTLATIDAVKTVSGSDGSLAIRGIVGSLITMVPLVASAWLITLLQNHPELRRKPAWLVSAALCVLFALVVTNPISSARFISGTVLLGLLFTLKLTQRPSSFRATASAVFASLLLIFPYADLYRYANSTFTLQPLSKLLTSKLDYDTAAQMVGVIDYRQATGGTGGGQILGVLGFLVPRAYWTSKPGNTGALITEYLHVPLTNVGSPLWVETYIDGGFIAVIIVFTALGFVMTRLSQTHAQYQYADSFVRVMVPLIAAYALIFLRGSLVIAVGPLLVMIALGWLVTSPDREWSVPGSSARHV